MAMLLYLSGIWVRLIFREHCGKQIGDFRIQWKVTLFFLWLICLGKLLVYSIQ